MATGAGWEFCRTSIPEPAFLCLLEVEKNLLKLRQILLELLKRCRNALGNAGMFRNSVGNAGMFWNAILQYKHLQALVEPTLSPCFLGGREGGIDLPVGSATSHWLLTPVTHLSRPIKLA